MTIGACVVIVNRMFKRHTRCARLNSHSKMDSGPNLGSLVLITRQGHSSSGKIDIFDADIADNLIHLDINLLATTL